MNRFIRCSHSHWNIVLGVFCAWVIVPSVKADEIRRVVTTLDAGGKAIALFDTRVPLKAAGAGSRATSGAILWSTEGSPADPSVKTDMAAKVRGLATPKGGTVFRLVEYPPTTPEQDAQLPLDSMMKIAGDHAPSRGMSPRHPAMHRTRTVDYAVIMSGEIDMLLDDSVLHFKPGDVVIQQATNHAWVNHGKEPCRILFVLIDSKEP